MDIGLEGGAWPEWNSSDTEAFIKVKKGSIGIIFQSYGGRRIFIITLVNPRVKAFMVELVDTLDLGSSGFGRVGSSPTEGTYRL